MLADIPSFSELISTAEIKAVDYPGVYASRYSSLAGLVIFLYDIFLTFPDEVKYLWSSVNSPVRWFYFINRYLAIPFLILSNFTVSAVICPMNCWNSTAVIGVVQEICMVAGKIILLLRVMALYSNGRTVSIIMILLLLACCAGSGTSLALTLVDIKSGPKEIQFQTHARICLMTKRPLPLIGIPSLVFFDLSAVVLTAYKAIEHAKQGRELGKSGGILFTLWTDGVVYFIIVAASHAVSILVWTKKICPANMFFLGMYLQWAVTAAITARLVLRLRKANVKGSFEPFSTTTVADETNFRSAIVFSKGSNHRSTSSGATTYVERKYWEDW